MNWRVVFCCWLALAFCTCAPDKSSVSSDQSIGNEIIAALEKFRHEKGHYPTQLSELVPKHIPEIKSPSYGEKRWDYNYKPGEDFFGLYMWGKKAYHDGYLYSSQRKQWEVVENIF